MVSKSDIIHVHGDVWCTYDGKQCLLLKLWFHDSTKSTFIGLGVQEATTCPAGILTLKVGLVNKA